MSDEFYQTYYDQVAQRLEALARDLVGDTPKFLVAKNDAFQYVILYIDVGFMWGGRYTCQVKMATHQFILHYTTYTRLDYPAGRPVTEDFRAERYALVFQNIPDLQTHLETLKPQIRKLRDDLQALWEETINSL